MESTPALDVQQVDVGYGSTPVVRNCSLQIRQGETFGLIGLNGVGKTTLIKAILGLRRHSAGNIFINGHDRMKAESKKQLAYLPERFDPPWFLRGEEFLRFSLRLYRRPYSAAEAHTLCEKVALDPAVLKNKVQTYSKGMRQKLGLIATLLTDCPLLILDEPMSGLDPQARASVKDALTVVKARGRTIFFTSHILADMNEICDRVGVFHDGTLIFCGTPAALLEAGGDANIERAFLNLLTPVPLRKAG